jgi:type II secretory pathway pseudopilin PulG
MHTRFHGRNFGVLEIIVSVAILAAFSVFVLRLFVAASNDEKKMLELDRADYAAVSYIEQFKNSAAPFDMCGSLGRANPSGGDYDNTVALSGIKARIEIKKDSENALGGLYTISVDMIRSSDSADIYKLSGLKFFTVEK